MNVVRAAFYRMAGWCLHLMARTGIPLLRLSLGTIFLGFGVLKYFPGVSPAEAMAEETIAELTFGLIDGRPGLLLVATLESAIGFCLITGWYLRLSLALLGLAMVGILSPLVLLPELLFRWPLIPTLAGQYVLKDLVLVAAGLVVAVGALGGRLVTGHDRASSRSGA